MAHSIAVVKAKANGPHIICNSWLTFKDLKRVTLQTAQESKALGRLRNKDEEAEGITVNQVF